MRTAAFQNLLGLQDCQRALSGCCCYTASNLVVLPQVRERFGWRMIHVNYTHICFYRQIFNSLYSSIDLFLWTYTFSPHKIIMCVGSYINCPVSKTVVGNFKQIFVTDLFADGMICRWSRKAPTANIRLPPRLRSCRLSCSSTGPLASSWNEHNICAEKLSFLWNCPKLSEVFFFSSFINRRVYRTFT